MLQDFGAQSQSSSNPISVVPLATGRAVSLGAGDQVAGDPQAPGAFVSVAAPAAPSASIQGGADAQIVLRDAGRPPVLLATAAALNSDLGYARSLPASLDPVPSPSGSEVAVAVRPEGASVTGIVILNRTGQSAEFCLSPRCSRRRPGSVTSRLSNFARTPPSSGRDDAGLVREDDQVDAVAGAEFGEQVADEIGRAHV